MNEACGEGNLLNDKRQNCTWGICGSTAHDHSTTSLNAKLIYDQRKFCQLIIKTIKSLSFEWLLNFL